MADDPVDVEDLTFAQEVEATMLATGVSEERAEFMVALRRGEVAGCVEDVARGAVTITEEDAG